MKREDLIINYDYEDHMWYVQEVALLDMGRFPTIQQAEDHKRFLEEKRSDS